MTTDIEDRADMVRLTVQKNAVIYTRISDDPKELKYGVDRQMGICDELAATLNVNVVARFKENDLSAYKKNVVRPEFNKVLAMVQSGRVDMIIVYHLDRYLRRSYQLELLIDAADKGVEICSARGGNLDLSTSGGRMTARILVAVAQQESEHHAERRVDANIQKAARGDWEATHRPFGYGVIDEGTGEIKIAPHIYGPEADALRTMAADALKGESLRNIARTLNNTGMLRPKGHKWDGSTVRGALTNPRYAALKVHKGKVVAQGSWPAILTEDTHYALRAVFDDPARCRTQTYDRTHLGSGLYVCGKCGAKMRGDNGGTYRTRFYTCRAHKHNHCAGKPADDKVTLFILLWFAHEEAHKLIENPVDLSELIVARKAIEGKLASLDELWDAGDINVEQYRRGSRAQNDQLAIVQEQLTAATGIATSPAASLISEGAKAHAQGTDAGAAVAALWGTLSVAQRDQAITEIATVTINAPLRQGPGFSDERVVITALRTDWTA